MLCRGNRLLAALCATVALAGCGSFATPTRSADVKAIHDLLGKLQAFSRSGDGQRICDELLTVRLAATIASSSRTGSCAKEIRLHTYTPEAVVIVTRVVVQGMAAEAQITIENGVKDVVSLIKYKGEWRIRRIALDR